MPFSYPWGGEARDLVYAARDQWLGQAFDAVGVKADPALRRRIVSGVVNALYDMLFRVTGDPAQSCVHVVDCRGAMPDVSLWNDKIHGNDDGFSRVAVRFRAKIDAAIAPAGERRPDRPVS